MKIKKLNIIGIAAALIIFIIDFVFFFDNQKILYFLAGIGAIAGVAPYVLQLSLESKNEQKINELFLEFTRNLAESVSTGTPISKSIVNMRHRNYDIMNPYVEKLANQIELGIPIEKALETFASDLGSDVVMRAIGLIREAERAGGEIDFILDSTAKSISEVDKLKKERKAAIYSMVVEGYIIFFIFIGIIMVMQFKILPLTKDIGNLPSMSGGVSDFTKDTSSMKNDKASFDASQMTAPFLYLLLTQGFFAGLIIGKLAEGTLKAGVKHSFALMITAYLVSTGSQLFVAAPGAVMNATGTG